LLTLRAEQAVCDLVDGDHAAAGRGGDAEQPGTNADQETRLHRHILAVATLRRGKERDKVAWRTSQTTQMTELIAAFAIIGRPSPATVCDVAQLLLVEDDASIRHALVRALTERGHVVSSTVTALDALQQVVAAPPDLVILDLGLPGLDGYEALRMLRAVSEVPVVVATARDDETDIVRALNAGADDYLVKPFGPGQIDARIRAVLRRANDNEPRRPAPIQVGGLWLDGEAYEAMLDGIPLDLSKREFDLLLYLARHAGQVVPKRDLLTHVWRLPYGGADKTVDVHVSWLRRKMGETAQQPRYLYTVRGVGIKLAAPA
jgi:DNA-binding response OmpR family regulator